MNNEQQNHEEEIFLQALDIAPGKERVAWLEKACDGDPDLRLSIEELLKAHDEPATLLVATEVGAGSSKAGDARGEQAGDRFGSRYELIEEIGRGGMGTVWLAEQSEPVQRKVALKIIKLGMDTREVVARFEAERQALAMMDHPGIAKVFDAGATEQGRLYFVMELVRGVPLTEFCDQTKLDTRERLELFAQICEAVQHAHQKGIIHRDLKPSNILVTNQDGRPLPKVIDFGVAKATAQSLTESTLFTRHGQMIGTLGYMSPEQAGGGSDVDTRSDVYSLGVLLYELLTGSTPFDARQIREAAFDEICRMVREVDPPKPSTRLSSLGERGSAVAEQRRTDPKKLGRTVRGELDWIAMKALDKDRSRRYQSAADLGGDIGHYLRGEAVEAGPPSQIYRFRKFARRHHKAFGVAAVVLLLLVAIGANSWYLGEQGRREKAANKADRLYERLLECKIESLPYVVADIEQVDPLVYARLEPALRTAVSNSSLQEIERVRAVLAIPTSERGLLDTIKTWLLKAPPRDMAIVLGMLDKHAVELSEFAWEAIDLKKSNTEKNLRAACILATFEPTHEGWKQINVPVVKWLTSKRLYQVQEWLPLLEPARVHLTEPLTQRYLEGKGTNVGESAAIALRRYEKDVDHLVSLIRKADPRQMPHIVDALLDAPYGGALALHAELNTEFKLKAAADGHLSTPRERSRLAIALFLMGDDLYPDWTCLDAKKDPTMRTYVITEMAKHAVPFGFLKNKMDDESNSPALISSLILALGNYHVTQLTKLEREAEFRDKIGAFYTEHEDAGVHSSAEWILKHWDMTDFRKELDEKIRSKPAEEKRNQGWYLGPEGHTMAYIDRSEGGFAIATKETTVAQFRKSKISMRHFRKGMSPRDDCPVNSIPAYDAMRYCNWLSEQDKIPPEEYCYEECGGQMWLRGNFEELRGFRLPSSAEFETAGLAGSTVTTSFGNAPAMLKLFAWYEENARRVSQPVGRLMPNHFGLFDIIGNLFEICHKTVAGGRTAELCTVYGGWSGTSQTGLQMEGFDIRIPHTDVILFRLDYSGSTFRVVQNNRNP
jgi:serine/threonine protein kinase